MRNFLSHFGKWAVWCLISISALGFGARLAKTAQADAATGPILLSDQPEIDAGFRLMYELKFSEARAMFTNWENRHPGEALGHAAEAASYLFQEYDRQGVLTSDCFPDDRRLLGGVEGTPAPRMRDAFDGAVWKARDLARAR